MEENKLKPLAIGNENLADLLGLDIVAFQLAEGGAMGYHGGVFFVTSAKKVYFTCYLEPSTYTGFSKYMSMENLEKVFPPLTDFNCGFMGFGAQKPEGWHYSYLGFGNHLLVRDDLHEDFNKAVKKLQDDNPGSILYNQWLPAILSVLKQANAR